MHGTLERVRLKPTALPITDRKQADLLEELAQTEARKSFWCFRQRINPDMLKGWWQREVAYELDAFYKKLVAGERPFLVLMAPPQHGKSKQVTDFIAYVAGQNPDLKTMFTSYSDDLGIITNTALQRIYDSDLYKTTFPGTRISDSNVVTVSGRWQRNSSFIEYIDRKGSFRNTTVGGQINGMGLDFGVIDDPIKGRKEAQSKTHRDNVWSWLTDDFFGRFSDKAGMLMIMTRWHIDDPMGRFIEKFPETRILRYPALAARDESHRAKGEALFPEHKSKEFLLQRKKLLTIAGWESLYQQNPIIAGGEVFPIENFEIVEHGPNVQEIQASVRYWDKAATKDGGAYTCGVLMHLLKDGRFFIDDVRRGQISAYEREKLIKTTCEADEHMFDFLETWVEQEPGSGGKESAQRTIANLRGHVVKADRVTGDKETRAEPYAAQVQGSNVLMRRARWNRDFLDEHETWPSSKYKDQVDAAAGAFAKLAENEDTYDESLAWVDAD